MKPGDLVRIIDYSVSPDAPVRIGILTSVKRRDQELYPYGVLVDGEVIWYNLYHIKRIGDEPEAG